MCTFSASRTLVGQVLASALCIHVLRCIGTVGTRHSVVAKSRRFAAARPAYVSSHQLFTTQAFHRGCIRPSLNLVGHTGEPRVNNLWVRRLLSTCKPVHLQSVFDTHFRCNMPPCFRCRDARYPRYLALCTGMRNRLHVLPCTAPCSVLTRALADVCTRTHFQQAQFT